MNLIQTALRRRSDSARALLLSLAALTLPSAAAAIEPLQAQWHGFAAQAFAVSDGNNYVGESLDGSLDFYEIGVNGAVGWGALTVSAQALARRFGALDSGDIRLDYAFVDYLALSTMSTRAGLRLGRVKNQYGLFNDSRDVVFTRPGILLPSSVYFEGVGVRNLLFSSDGGQLYAGRSLGDHYLSFSGTRALNFQADEEQKRSLFGGGAANFELNIDGLTIVRLQDEWAGGTWRAALTYTDAAIVFESNQQPSFVGQLDADIWVASLRHTGERYGLIAEYQITRIVFASDFTGRDRSTSDGGYVQLDYRFDPRWTGMLRYDMTFSDRNDRNGREFAESTGGDRTTRYARDLTVGLKWLPDAHWGVWAEHHFIRGSASAPGLENRDRELKPDANLFLLMLAYHF